MVLRIDPPLPVETPKGAALAHFLLDYGVEYDVMFICFINETGECWTFRGPEVRAVENETMGRKRREE